MAATVQIREKNGAGQTATDKTSGTVRFKDADNSTVDLNNPLIVPGSGQEYSFEKWLRLHIASGTFTQISNLRAYTDGSNGYGTGIKLWHALDGTYSTPAVPTESNDPPQHDAVGMTDFFAKTSGSPADLDAINTGPFDSTGLPKDIGDYLVLVVEVEPTASQGLKTAETITFAWDEI
jgi:hypothetical protein